MNFEKLETETTKEYNERILKEILKKIQRIESINKQLNNLKDLNESEIEKQFSKAYKKELSMNNLLSIVLPKFKSITTAGSLSILLSVREYTYSEINLSIALLGINDINEIKTDLIKKTGINTLYNTFKKINEQTDITDTTDIPAALINNEKSILNDSGLELRKKILTYKGKLKYWSENLKKLQTANMKNRANDTKAK